MYKSNILTRKIKYVNVSILELRHVTLLISRIYDYTFYLKTYTYMSFFLL